MHTTVKSSLMPLYPIKTKYSYLFAHITDASCKIKTLHYTQNLKYRDASYQL